MERKLFINIDRPLLENSDIERFWGKVNKSPHEKGCWIWKGSLRGMGYGQFFHTDEDKKRRNISAHRIAYFLFTDVFPDKMVLHTCDNPACVNPNHLFLGMHKDNADDMVSKGRNHVQLGSIHHSAKKTESQVNEIKAKYRAGGITQQQLAVEYNTDQGSISALVNNKRWKHLKEKEV